MEDKVQHLLMMSGLSVIENVLSNGVVLYCILLKGISLPDLLSPQSVIVFSFSHCMIHSIHFLPI